MKKLIVTLLTLCMVAVVVPPVSNGDNSEDSGISTYAYYYRLDNN